MAYEPPLVVEASSAKTATGNGTPQQAGPAANLAILLDVTAVTGTSPTMTVSVQWSHDGTAWFDADPADSFAALTAAAKKAKQFAVRAPTYRLAWTIGGTTPSFTFSAARYLTG